MAKNNYIAAVDVGNGLVKAQLSGEVITYQSIVGVKYGGEDLPIADSEAGELIEADIYNNLDASFESPLVENKARRIFGTRGLKSGYTTEEFDVYSNTSKAEVDLFGALVLGTIAAKVLKDYWASKKTLPKDIVKVNTILTTALPIAEYRRHREPVAKKFMKTSHIVTIHNFDTPVRIEIIFDDVRLLSEGEAAGYGLMLSDDKLIERFLDDARASGQVLEGITAKDIKGAGNSLGIDVGEGTTNFAVFQNGRFEFNASRTYGRGYGKVLEESLERLRGMGYPYKDRKEILDFLMAGPTNLTRQRYNKVLDVVLTEMKYFSQELSAEASKAIARTGGFVEIIFVYGGGSRMIKDAFMPELMKLLKVTGADDDTTIPVLYLDSEYASFLNMNGLDIIANQIAKKRVQKEKAENKGKAEEK